MDKVFKISELISDDIRSRSNAEIIRSALCGVHGSVSLDFTGVVFMSRSFADELYNIVSENKNITLTNMDGIVKSMYQAVYDGRNSVRVFNKDTSKIQEIKDMKGLASFFATF